TSQGGKRSRRSRPFATMAADGNWSSRRSEPRHEAAVGINLGERLLAALAGVPQDDIQHIADVFGLAADNAFRLEAHPGEAAVGCGAAACLLDVVADGVANLARRILEEDRVIDDAGSQLQLSGQLALHPFCRIGLVRTHARGAG